MKQQHSEDQVVPYPKGRHFLEAAIRSTHHKAMIHGLIEVDVSRARAYLREHQAKTGESLSFTAFIMTCLAKAVDEHKAVQAMRLGSKRLILFADVDVLTYIEREVAGQKQIMPYIVRAANRKTFREIHHEIRAAQVQDLAKAEVGGAKRCSSCRPGSFARTSGSPPGSAEGIPRRGRRPGGR
jgi:pyruvate/2-oxoglutarate dehydrogenase complex dihydrolipoamide acyltransferase (E2) component